MERTLPALYVGLHGKVTTASDTEVEGKSHNVVFSADLAVESKSSSRDSRLLGNAGHSNHPHAGGDMPHADIEDANVANETVSRRLSTFLSSPSVGGYSGAATSLQTSQIGQSVSVGLVMNSAGVPTKRPSAPPSLTSKSATMSGIPDSPRNALVDDIERMFSVSSPQAPTQRSNSYVPASSMSSSASSIAPSSRSREAYHTGHISGYKDNSGTPGNLYSEWFFSGQSDILTKNIVDSSSEKLGLFDQWLAAEEVANNRTASAGMRFFSPSGGGYNNRAADATTEMSALGRVSMRNLRDRERTIMKKWVAYIDYFHTKGAKEGSNALQSVGAMNDAKESPQTLKRGSAGPNLKKNKIAKAEIVMVYGRYPVTLIAIRIDVPWG